MIPKKSDQKDALLSIIIPVYNMERYVQNCIKSIYKDNPIPEDLFEVIIVDDGSTDSSFEILDKVAKAHPNITIFYKPNGGLSSARNLALEKATGRYVFFLDSDDTIVAQNLILSLQTAIRFNLDLLGVNYVKVDENGDDYIKQDKKYLKNLNGKIVDAARFFKYYVFPTGCFYLYKRSLIVNNCLIFPHGLYHEDEDFITRFICVCNRISFTSLTVYRYFIRSGSIMNPISVEKKLKSYRDFKAITYGLIKLSETIENENLLRGLFRKININCIGLLFKLRNLPSSVINKKQEIDDMYQKGLLPLNICNNSLKHKLVSLMLSFRPFLHLFVR